MAEFSNKINPFPGLRHYGMDEGHLFFGRQRESEEVIKKLIINRFVAVAGPAGSGKSSLVHAGVVPLLANGFAASEGKAWRIIDIRPGFSPIDNIARALVINELQDESDESQEIRYNIKNALLRNSSRGLTEALRQLNTEYDENILLIIDNFEELFRVTGNRTDQHKNDEYKAFVSLLADTVNEETLPAYILVSIRNDYLNEALQPNDLSILINRSNYLLPPMDEVSLREVITEPLRVTGGNIDSRVVERILKEDPGHSDILPFLQYVLMRMWDNRAKENDPPITLTEEDYESVGKLKNSLSIHAEEAYNELSDNGRLICERLFKIVAVKLSDNRFISNPTRVSDLAFITRTAVSDVIDIIERFRCPGRTFLEPRYKEALNSDSVVVLTHEVLIIMWPRLKHWVEEEFESVAMYRRLSEASKKYQMGKEQLLSPPVLQAALKWREKNKPTFEWARRFDSAFERTMAYVSKSEEVFNEQEEEKLEKPRKLFKRARIIAGLLLIATLVLSAVTYHYAKLYSGDEQAVIPVYQLSHDTVTGITDTSYIEPEEQEIVTESAKREPAGQTPQVTDERLSEEAVTETAAQITSLPDQAEVEVPEVVKESETVRDERSESYARRMIAVSQAMAVKSLQDVKDRELKALLASQAHLFNEKYGGRENQADIFKALHASLKGLYGDSYNIYSGHSESVNSVVFNPNGSMFYSASSDGKVLQWNIANGAKVSRTLLNQPVIINRLAITPNGQWLACATEGRGIQVINPSRNNPVPVQVSWGNNRIIAMDFYPDNENLVFAGSDNKIVKWNIRTRGHEVLAANEHDIMSLSVSPDGNRIVAGTRSGSILLWEDEEHSVARKIYHEEGDAIYSVRFSRNGELVAAGSLRGNLGVWDVSSGRLVARLTGHSARVMDIEFSPDNKKIASVSFDGTVHLWDALNFGSAPVVFSEHESWVHSVAFSPSGNKMVSGSRNSRLIILPARSNEMIPLICDRLTRSFTRSEWELYVGEDIPMTSPCP